eukprot:1203018-Rhodomonas_salina.1
MLSHTPHTCSPTRLTHALPTLQSRPVQATQPRVHVVCTRFSRDLAGGFERELDVDLLCGAARARARARWPPPPPSPSPLAPTPPSPLPPNPARSHFKPSRRAPRDSKVTSRL